MRALVRKLYHALFGLQFRTTVLLSLVVLAATGVTSATYLRISSRLALTQKKLHAGDLAKALASAGADAVEKRDREALLAIAEGIVPGSEVSYLLFTDVSGEILAGHQQGAGHITHLLLNNSRQVSVEPINHPQISSEGSGGAKIDLVYPVQSTTTVVGDDMLRPTVGYVRLGVSLASSEQRLAEMVHIVIGLTIGITLLMVPIGYEVVRNLVGPLNRLTEATRAFARGELDARVHLKRRDEIGELGGAFNAMADELTVSHNKLVMLNAELENRVAQRTRALERANRRFREMASRDSLTGLFNRRRFNDLLVQLFAESNRYRTELTCMMLDLDNFKRVNDSLGHQTGDELLRMTADVIQQCVRESDVVVRFGGDEFIVLLPQTTPAEARASAERILAQFRDELAHRFPAAGVASLSIGLASRQEDRPVEAMALVQLADEALYLAKAGGKNRITVLQPVANEG